MIQKTSEWFYQKIRLGWLLFSTVLFILFLVFVLPAQADQAQTYSAQTGSPDTSFFYSRQQLFDMAEDYGEAGRQAYVQARFSFDLIFPLVYTFFLITSISWLLRRSAQKQSIDRRVNLLPAGALILDVLENICAAAVMAAYPTRLPVFAWLATVFTPLKWLMVGINFLLLLVIFILFVHSRIKSQIHTG